MRSYLAKKAIQSSYDYKYIIYRLRDTGRLTVEEYQKRYRKIEAEEKAKEQTIYEETDEII